MSNPHRDKAVSLLQHYFRMIGEKSDMKWNADLDLEVGQIVDEIFAAAAVELDRLLAERAAAVGLTSAAFVRAAPKPKAKPAARKRGK